MRVELQDVSLRYQKRNGSVQAIKDFSLRTQSGEFVSIIGPSGCGKTTLLKMMAGLLEPTSGKVLIDDCKPQQIQKRIGFAFQNALLLPWRTALENVLLPIEILSEKGSHDFNNLTSQDPKDLLDKVGLQGFYDSYPRELSGGMQQRVALARTLIFNPDILLMDEPFGALDGITREKMQFLLLSLWEKQRKTILFVTHDITEAIFLGDRVIVLSERPGTVVADIPIEIRHPRKRNLKLTDQFLKYEDMLWSHLGET